MPVVIPKGLPAEEVLIKENIFTMNEDRARTQDIRAIEVLIVNLMPTKITTEVQLLRRLSNSPLQINVELLRTASYESRNTSLDHLEKFYTVFDEIKDKRYDAMIITGAPVENLRFENVDYWGELKKILDFAKEKVYSTMFICWGAQAALYYYYGIEKYSFDEKLSGVYKYDLLSESQLTKGFNDTFNMPQSRYTYNSMADVQKIPELKILSGDDETGVNIVTSLDERLVFVTGHWEYDRATLDKEYTRDVLAGIQPNVPENYYVDDNPNHKIIANWRAESNLFFSNWLNYGIYQVTPYDLNQLTPIKIT